MENLLEETLKILSENNRNESDVNWVGNTKFYTSWEHFKNIAKNINYDSGYGAPEIALIFILNAVSMMVLNGGSLKRC